MRIASAAAALAILAACGAPLQQDERGLPMLELETILADQVARYPNMQPEDLYKLLHQATMGPAHMFMGTASHLETGLTHEVRALEPSPTTGEREIEVIHPSRGLARVNLRPFLQNGGKIEHLARAIARTSHAYRGDLAELRATLDAAADRVEPLGFAFSAQEFSRTTRDMQRKGFPSARHSEVYAQTYEPAYRLVLLTHLQDPEFGGRIDSTKDAAEPAPATH